MTTYFTMKERAGTVGANGLAPVLQRIRAELPALRMQLAGHSFGGRLVTAAVNALPKGAANRVQSLFLMQAAFSHYGMAQKYDGTSNGLFRSVIADGKVTGPIYITFTGKDKAVGLAYPLASRLGGQVAAGLGDANDKYGGIGRNGAQKTPEAVTSTLLPSAKAYSFTPGGVFNLDANATITAHSDICRAEVAHALISAIATT
jgi:pimeloyl-ACP methyl ester carboxylesterase